jgi:hypothetical protein
VDGLFTALLLFDASTFVNHAENVLNLPMQADDGSAVFRNLFSTVAIPGKVCFYVPMPMYVYICLCIPVSTMCVSCYLDECVMCMHVHMHAFRYV